MYRKNINKFIGALLVLLSLLAGCKDIETTTEIYPDGSCKRIVFAKGDSSEIFSSSFPIPTDSSWTITQYDSGEFTYIAEKTFKKVADWDKEMNYCQDQADKLIIIPELKRNFRWFYTVYKYTETYKAFNRMHNVPMTDYLTPEEIQLFGCEDDTTAKAKQVEQKFEEWDKHNTFEGFYQDFIRMTRELKDSILTIARLNTMKNKIYDLYVDELYDNFDYKKTFLKKLGALLGAKSIEQVESDLILAISKNKNRQEKLAEIGLSDFEHTVIMPGVILDTNANTVEGNKVAWKIEPARFMFTDFTMTVESRLVNIWAVVITLVLFVIAVLILLLPLILRKKK